MSGDLYLFPIPDEPGAFDVARMRGGKPAFARATPEAPVDLGGVDRVVLIAPGEDVALHRIDTPVRSDSQALAAARFAIEDDLAEAIEDVEVRLGPRVAGSPREAFVASRARLEAWRDALAAVRATADVIVPDYSLLPVEADALLVVDMGGRIVVRGPGVGFAADAALAPALLAAALEANPGLGVRLRTARPDAILPHAARNGRRVQIENAPSDGELLELVRQGLAEGPSVNLAAAARKVGGAIDLKTWRLSAGIAAAAAIAFFALIGGQTLALRSHAAAAEADAAAVLRAAFPDRTGDPRAVLRTLSAGGSGASFLELSAVLADSVGQVPAMQIESLRFDEADGRLTASVAYAAYSDVQTLKATIEARGLTLTEGASRMQSGRMAGEIVVGSP